MEGETQRDQPIEHLAEHLAERLEISCIMAGAAMVGWMFILNYMLKPLAVVIMIVLAATAAIAPVGITIGFLLHHSGEPWLGIITGGVTLGIAGTCLLVIIGTAVWGELAALWRKHGHRTAWECQNRKRKTPEGQA